MAFFALLLSPPPRPTHNLISFVSDSLINSLRKNERTIPRSCRRWPTTTFSRRNPQIHFVTEQSLGGASHCVMGLNYILDGDKRMFQYQLFPRRTVFSSIALLKHSFTSIWNVLFRSFYVSLASLEDFSLGLTCCRGRVCRM